MNTSHSIYCGGTFCFDYQTEGFKAKAEDDYRAILLGSVDTLLRPKDMNGVMINQNVSYIGPFYFESENMVAEEIVSCEKQMIEKCTDAIFFLDEAACPGSIAEMIYANTLQKKIHIFYVKNADGEETESSLHTPCWYPILFCQMTNSRVTLYSCASQEDAKCQIVELVKCGLL